jgi:5-methylcytosine-specific restriction endonuclease McrA
MCSYGGVAEVWSLWPSEADRRVRVAPETEETAGQHVRTVPVAYGREHYLANRQKYIDSEAKRKRGRARARTRYLLEYFRAHPCSDCGETDPLVLEFDHLRDKRFEVTNQFASRNWQEILDEIAKCEVVCANCHRRRTARPAGYLRAVLSGSSGP